MIYVTGDTHGDFDRIANFCARMNTKPSDIMIILGDAGINFYGGWRDLYKKEFVSKLPITLFCIHGNHERRPATIATYVEKEWHGGNVYVEERYPSILFAKDGEVYELNGKRTIVIGGAYSIDWMLRTPGQSWWPDEQPSDEVKACVEQKLELIGWDVDIVLTHTAPLKYEPVEAFLPFIDQKQVDKTTEAWLGMLEERLSYRKWFCGHYHIRKNVGNLQFMYSDFDVLCDM